MAATGATPISLYYSTSAGVAPTAGNLVAGELAINTNDGILYYKDSSGVVQKIASKATGVVAGTTTQVIYNNAGAYAGSANMTFDGTKLTVGGLKDSALTSGRVTYATTSGELTDSANFTFNGTTVTIANDASISGLTVGKGGGSQSTNTAIGNGVIGTSNSGGSNTGLGYLALTANTTGAQQTAVGAYAAYQTTTGTANSAFGYAALGTNTTGANNVAIGNIALYSNTTASNNTAVGFQAGYSNTTTTYNTFVGYQAGYALNGTFGSNTFIGTYAGNAVTTGYNNTIIGSYTGNNGGLDIRTASNYIVLSDGAGNPNLIINNNKIMSVGTTATDNPAGGFVLYVANQNSQFMVGHESGTPSGYNFAKFCYNSGAIGSITQNGTTAVAYNTTSDYRLKTDVSPIKNGLSTIELLNPVNFNWADGRNDDGFIAHELQNVIPNCVTGEKDAVNEDGTPKYQQMDSSGVIPFLVAAIKELKAEVDSLKQQLGK